MRPGEGSIPVSRSAAHWSFRLLSDTFRPSGHDVVIHMSDETMLMFESRWPSVSGLLMEEGVLLFIFLVKEPANMWISQRLDHKYLPVNHL